MSVDLTEARENVTKRLEFIEGELVKTDGLIASKQGSQSEIGDEITKLQQKMQQDAANAARNVISEI
jgi:hypothetical protein